MNRTLLGIALLAGAVVAQDHLYPVGHADAGGPKGPNGNSFPVARARDMNNDGLIDMTTEVEAFLKAKFGANPKAFMTDVRYVEEGGNLAFYFTDSENGLIVRGVDDNHNGLIDNAEAKVFYQFTPVSRFAPDAVALYRDTTRNETRVYVAMDNAPRGIHRLVDANKDGDAQDAGEASIFVDANSGLTVPGKSGPVAINDDYYTRVRCTPKGKVIAWNSGPSSSSAPQDPENFCWYIFTDTNGKASAQVWFNPSTLNGIPTHPDFDPASNGKFPGWDIAIAQTGRHPAWCDVSFLAVDEGGAFPGFDAYYIGATYRQSGFGDQNLQNKAVSGLFYRVVDKNFNELIDAGEIQLFANFSNVTYDNVAPFSYTDRLTTVVQRNLTDLPHGISAADGNFAFSWENKGNDAVIFMTDSNRNGVIESSEVRQSWVVPGGQGSFPYPFSTQFGAFTMGYEELARDMLPGPFPTGVAPYGNGCPTTRGLLPAADVGGGGPQVGNQAFRVRMLRGQAQEKAFFILGSQRQSLDLGSVNMPGCTLYTDLVITLGGFLTDNNGATETRLPVPNNPTLIGQSVYVQWVVQDLRAQGVLPFFTSNGLQITFQM